MLAADNNKARQHINKTYTYQVFHTNHTLEHNVCLVIVILVVDNTWAVNEEDALHEGDVLPHLSLTWHGCHLANLHHTTSSLSCTPTHTAAGSTVQLIDSFTYY